MNDDLISRQELRKSMYHEAMEKDSDEQKWDGGCWIRYKMFERVLEALPPAQPDKVFFVKANRLLSFDDLKSLKKILTDQCENIVLLPEDCSLVYPERKKAKWITELRPRKTDDEEFDYWYTYCSVCGCQKRIGWFDAKFCPNCGADLRGDEDV